MKRKIIWEEYMYESWYRKIDLPKYKKIDLHFFILKNFCFKKRKIAFYFECMKWKVKWYEFDELASLGLKEIKWDNFTEIELLRYKLNKNLVYDIKANLLTLFYPF
jgi:hypothetical protein